MVYLLIYGGKSKVRDKKEDTYRLYRVTIIKVKKKYIKAKDSNGRRYRISKSPETERYTKGLNCEFYAEAKVEGILKRKILYAIDYEEYIK